MLFGKEALKEMESYGGGSKIPVGIHSKITVSSVEVGVDFIDFNYLDESSNRVNNKRVWFPKLDTIKPKVDKTTGLPAETLAEAFERISKNRFNHIIKHMKIFLPVEVIDAFNPPDVPTAAMRAAAMFTPAVLGAKKVNLKVIVDPKSGYTTFGNFTDYIEEYVEGQAPTLEFSKEERKNIAEKDNPVMTTNDSVVTDTNKLY